MLKELTLNPQNILLITDANVDIEVMIDAVKKSAPDGSACIADLYLTGPTNIVAAGEILDEELSL